MSGSRLKAKFGDLVENGWASEANPTRVGYFVREFTRPRKQMNPGLTWEITDGNGKFWELKPTGEHKITVATALAKTVEVDCPRCMETCGWCGDYRWMHGQVALPGGAGYRRYCTIDNMVPDAACAVCGGSKRVLATTTFRPLQPVSAQGDRLADERSEPAELPLLATHPEAKGGEHG